MSPPSFLVALPCPALPCPALPCPALPCPALPCPALPCPNCRVRSFKFDGIEIKSPEVQAVDAWVDMGAMGAGHQLSFSVACKDQGAVSGSGRSGRKRGPHGTILRAQPSPFIPSPPPPLNSTPLHPHPKCTLSCTPLISKSPPLLLAYSQDDEGYEELPFETVDVPLSDVSRMEVKPLNGGDGAIRCLELTLSSVPEALGGEKAMGTKG